MDHLFTLRLKIFRSLFHVVKRAWALEYGDAISMERSARSAARAASPA